MANDTKDKIVAGAYRALVRSGYSNTSVKDIAAEAEVAPGLVHYYFESKEDLLVAAIEYGCAGTTLDVGSFLGMDPAAAARKGFETEKLQLRTAPDLYRLVLDMFGVGLHNPKIAAAVERYIRERLDVIKGIGHALVAGAPVRSPIDGIAAVIWGAFVGISLQKLNDPEFDADQALDALADMVFSYLPQAAGKEAR
ncbi:MAG: TetR/AcrR family transcriptional regulator [Candidatus Dormibacteraceae bacterium]